MDRIPLAELERRCQKPGHRQIGNWMARRVSRPVALRVTWIVAPWGVSANQATLVAWVAAAGAAAAFGFGTSAAWVVGAGLLQVWYLLDHIDGQLARLRGTASLDGVQLDYLMHHSVQLVVPIALGWGVAEAAGEKLWIGLGVVWGVAGLLIGLIHDARYKAFIQRLKRIEGRLEVVGGGGGKAQPQPPIPLRPDRLVAWAARKCCEAHVVMNLVSLLAVIAWMAGDARFIGGRCYVTSMACLSVSVAAASIWRSQVGHVAEAEFAAWFRVPYGCELAFRDGIWTVRPVESAEVCLDPGRAKAVG